MSTQKAQQQYLVLHYIGNKWMPGKLLARTEIEAAGVEIERLLNRMAIVEWPPNDPDMRKVLKEDGGVDGEKVLELRAIWLSKVPKPPMKWARAKIRKKKEKLKKAEAEIAAAESESRPWRPLEWEGPYLQPIKTKADLCEVLERTINNLHQRLRATNLGRGSLITKAAPSQIIENICSVIRKLGLAHLLQRPKKKRWTADKEIAFLENLLADCRKPDRSPAVALTDEDRYILTVLNAQPGNAMTFRRIEMVSAQMNRDDATKIRRLSDTMIRHRVPVLLDCGLVARPPHTKKKGITITDAGRQTLAFAAANPPETHRKS